MSELQAIVLELDQSVALLDIELELDQPIELKAITLDLIDQITLKHVNFEITKSIELKSIEIEAEAGAFSIKHNTFNGGIKANLFENGDKSDPLLFN